MNNEIKIAKYFLPKVLSHIEITSEDEKMFLEYTSKGMHKDKLKKSHFDDGFNALVYGKKYAGINMGLWEQGILEGTMPVYTLLGGEENKPIPSFVVSFMKKELFRGEMENLITDCYDEIRHKTRHKTN